MTSSNEIDKEVFWSFLKDGKSCDNCYWRDKQNLSPIRSKFEARCMGCTMCTMYDDLPYWEPKWKDESNMGE